MDIPGDTSTTTTLNPGDELTSEISPIGDIDLIRTHLSLNLAYGFTLTTGDADLDQVLELLNSTGGFINSASGDSTNPAMFSYTADATDTYFMRVDDSGNDDTGEYTLAINNNDTIVDSLSTTETLAAGSSLTSAIDVVSDADVISTSLTQDLAYGFTLTTSDADLDQVLELLNSTGGFINSASGDNVNAAMFSYTADATDTYFMRVDDSANDDTGEYTLAINNNDTLYDTIETPDRMNPAGTLFSAIDVTSDGDVIGTDLIAGVTYNFCLSTTDTDLDQVLELLNSTGGFINSASGDSTNPAMFSYTADATDTYFMRIDDSGNNDTGEYQLLIYSNGDDTINGTQKGEEMHGGSGNDTLFGFGGADRIGGGEGDDGIYGGEGNDTVDYSTSATAVTVRLDLGTAIGEGRDILSSIESVIGSNLNDTIYGNNVTTTINTIHAGGGDDKVFGGRGSDEIYGESGADLLIGDSEMDLIYGGDDNDRIYGKFGSDELHGGEGADLVVGDAANDTLYGNEGNDRLFGGSGNDIMDGGAGADLYDGASGNDTFLSSAGADRLVSRGTGFDTFQFEQGNDNDRIFFFENNVDKIQISADFGISDGTDAINNHSRAVGNTLYIDLDPAGGDYIQMVNWLVTNTAQDLIDDISIF